MLEGNQSRAVLSFVEVRRRVRRVECADVSVEIDLVSASAVQPLPLTLKLTDPACHPQLLPHAHVLATF